MLTTLDARSQDVQAWIIEVLERRADAKKQLEELRHLRGVGGRASDERRLAVYKAARDSGLISAGAGYHVVAITLLHIADSVTEEDPRLRGLMQQMAAMREAHGEDWKEGEGPEGLPVIVAGMVPNGRRDSAGHLQGARRA